MNDVTLTTKKPEHGIEYHLHQMGQLQVVLTLYWAGRERCTEEVALLSLHDSLVYEPSWSEKRTKNAASGQNDTTITHLFNSHSAYIVMNCCHCVIAKKDNQRMNSSSIFCHCC